ncbi:MAG: endonuclease [Saprospiraceae bacterium]|nr:endonuclease [Saprospiraceae bacterium]
MRLFFIPFLLCLNSLMLSAQGFQVVFPGLNGAELIDSVASRYRPLTVLDYANARDTLYAKVLAIDDDSLRCIYSGHTLYLDPTQDPTQYIFQGGGTNGMNTEHAYPQAKGAADGNARSDMHHLYPTRVAVNEARGNSPYTDIPDAQTQKWFIGNQLYTSIPATNIDAYSEQRSDAFEPRESVKGDLARSVFYFYTMYQAQANLADPNYFELQRNTLCQWAQQDPADSVELRKTWRIAPYQEGKPNPFVIDCTLANRCWCPDVPPNCLVQTSSPENSFAEEILIWPNPAKDWVQFESKNGQLVSLQIFDLLGIKMGASQTPSVKGEISVQFLPKGYYWVEVLHLSGRRSMQPLIIQ